MLRVSYLVAGLVLAVLLVAVGGMGFVVGQSTHPTDESSVGPSTSEDDTGSMMGSGGGDGMGSMMNGGSMMGSMMGSFDDEGKPFDLQFIDQMIPHHEGALMSSEHMISNSKRPEMRQLYEDIQKSQSEQIEQMRAWREQWYPEAEPTSEMMDSTQMEGMMDSAQMDGMMGEGHMQEEMMGGDTADSMFLRMMIPHHQSAIDMSEQALERAEHPELRGLAQQIIDEQTAEIGLMEGYLEEIEASDGN